MNTPDQITRHFPFTPTAEQQEFCLLMQQFLISGKEDRCFVLRGYAGTGKTTSVAALVRALPSFKLRAVLLAPTGRAAKVISTYSGKKAFTIHKRIYRKVNAVTTDLRFQLAPNLAENTLFIVDEASMIADVRDHGGSSLLADLLKHVFQPGPLGKSKNCFLLMVGDTAQLPPVGSLESVALNGTYLKENYGLDVTGIELKEVVRQEHGSGILANATMLRSVIAAKASGAPKIITKGYKDMFRMPGVKLAEGLEYAYKKFGIDQSLVVCRSNKSANLFNAHIRAQLLYREEELTGGDHIMIVRNNYFWLPENKEADFIANGDMARVLRVRKQEERYGLRFAEVMLELPDFLEIGTINCKVILDTLTGITPNLSAEQAQQLYEGVMLEHEHLPTKALR